MELVRLNKHLKDLGLCSRRKADEFITKGYIKVNGQVITEMGYRVDPTIDKVEVLPGLEAETSQFRYILLNKPRGYVCSHSDADGKSVFELLPKVEGLSYAGRLDKDSHGLVLFSNDGKFSYRVFGAEFACEKEYMVRVDKPLTADYLYRQGNGSIVVDGVRVKRATVESINDYVYTIVLTQGLNRQIRKMAENQSYRVVDLKRIRIGKLVDRALVEGSWRDLSQDEIKLFIS